MALALALRDATVLDQLGEALRSDLVTPNPYHRRVAEFADEFLLHYRKLPGDGDWEMWLSTLDEGLIRDGTKETLQRIWALDVSGFDPQYFASQALPQLHQAAVTVARARLNEVPIVAPDAIAKLAEELDRIQVGAVQGLARLDDIDTWSRPVREDALLATGYPTLDRTIGGWGKELWILFADSGVGKSMLLQNFAASAAQKGKRVLHVSLELGIRPQIHRYYRAITHMTKGEFTRDTKVVKDRLMHWFRMAQGELFLLEYTAYALDVDGLKRTIARLNRTIGDIDVLILDYLDLLELPRRQSSRNKYDDLGRLTHETRGLCPTFDLTALTASQAVRRPANSDRLTQRDMGDSYNKVRGADGLLALNQTDEEKKVFQGRLGLPKVRDSGGMGHEVPLYINRELSVIQELDHPNTKELMRRLGHLPEQLSGNEKAEEKTEAVGS